MDNSAFDEECYELARILRALADDIEGKRWEDVSHKRVLDVNGNSVGFLKITEEGYDE